MLLGCAQKEFAKLMPVAKFLVLSMAWRCADGSGDKSGAAEEPIRLLVRVAVLSIFTVPSDPGTPSGLPYRTQGWQSRERHAPK
ncbi:hypothetical protein GCM10027398_06350 [Azotobacter salinestris]